MSAEKWRSAHYAPYLMIAEAERFIAQHKQQPFLLYLACIEPHVALHPPQEALDRFPREWDTAPYRGGNGYLPHPRPRAAYAALISDLDQYVGRVLKALEDAGVADRTLVLFSSDNGATHEGQGEPRFHIGGADTEFFNSNGGLRGFKGSVYEGGLRVPLIARCPGRIKAGTESAAPSYFADWFPTLCEAAGLPLPDGLDGESLWPVLTGRAEQKAHKPMVWVYPEYGGQVAVRIGAHKVLRNKLNTRQPSSWEVYDLSSDPKETKNLAAERQDLIAEALAVLNAQTTENAVFPLKLPAAVEP